MKYATNDSIALHSAREIVDQAHNMGSTDNITAMVVLLDFDKQGRKYTVATPASASTTAVGASNNNNNKK